MTEQAQKGARMRKIKPIRQLLMIWLVAVSLQAAPLCRTVILVIIDGARYSETLGDPQGTYVPRMFSMQSEAVVVDNFINDGVTSTSRAIPAIWTGSWIEPRDTVYDGKFTQYTLTPSVWEYYRKASGQPANQAMYILKYLSSLWLPSFLPDYGPSYCPQMVSKGSSDIAVWNEAKAQLATYHPRLAVIYFADVDHYGHTGDWAQYTRAITIADSLVGLLWNFVQTDPIYRDSTAVIITNDHGRHLDGVSTGFQGHGCSCYGCRHIMLMGLGAIFQQGMHLSRVAYELPDITPTIGYILDFDTPQAEGQVMTALFRSTAVNLPEGSGASNWKLWATYPNPFNNSTHLTFEISRPERVRIEVFDLNGKYYQTLVQDQFTAGQHSLTWENHQAPAGLYFFVMQVGNTKQVVKGMLLK